MNMASALNQLPFQSSIGRIVISWNDEGHLVGVNWRKENEPCFARIGVPGPILGFVQELEGYFGSGQPLSHHVWQHVGHSEWTPFQYQVYHAIREIPHGETRTYAWVARKIGNISATRAVGQALRKNPLLILAPCHRVVATQSLGGFMGSSEPSDPELMLKQKLIELEHNYRNPVFSFLTPSWNCA